MKTNLILTCEHAGNKIPKKLQKQLNIPLDVLATHRGWDLGALKIAKKTQAHFGAPLFYTEMSRLVIDYNRSAHNPRIWSQYSKELEKDQKLLLLQEFHNYRDSIEQHITKNTFHLAIHSFTPILFGKTRNCEISFLYDPKNKKEHLFAHAAKQLLKAEGIRCRLNYPYFGISDCLPTYLRRKFPTKYAGIEVEFNQSIVSDHFHIKTFLDVCQKLIG